MGLSTIVFPVKGNQIYLSLKKKGFGTGFLNGYGGKGKEGVTETADEIALRELEEESKVLAQAKDLEKVAVVDFYKGEKHLYECHVYFLREWQGDFVETEEMSIPELYDRDNLPYDRMWKADLIWIPYIIKGEKIRAKVYYTPDMKEMTHFEHTSLV